MTLGLFYTPIGLGVLIVVYLTLVFVSFRRPLWGVAVFASLVPAVWLFTYDLPTRALLTAVAAVVPAFAALTHLRDRSARWTRPDTAFALVAAGFVVAAGHGWVAGNSRSLIASDIYNQLFAGSFVYAAVRLAVEPASVPTVVRGWVVGTAIVAAIQLAIVSFTPHRPEWIWLVGSPLDEGGVRLKPDFGFPTLALVGAVTWLIALRSRRAFVAVIVLATALVLTYKRTYTVAAVAASAVPVLAYRRHARSLASVVAAVVLAVGLAALTGANTASIRERTGDLGSPLSVPTVSSRVDEWGPVARAVVARPWGYGFGATIELPSTGLGSTPTGETRTAHYIHNAYLQWAFLAGVPTAAAAVGGLGMVGWGVWRRRRDPWALAVGAGVAASAVSALALQGFYSPIAAVGLALAVTRTHERAPDVGESDRASAPGH